MEGADVCWNMTWYTVETRCSTPHHLNTVHSCLFIYNLSRLVPKTTLVITTYLLEDDFMLILYHKTGKMLHLVGCSGVLR